MIAQLFDKHRTLTSRNLTCIGEIPQSSSGRSWKSKRSSQLSLEKMVAADSDSVVLVVAFSKT
jgi:hypothetical protein